MEAKLLFVETTNEEQRIYLEEEYLSKGSVFIVPTNETETLESILRSICFEYFQNSIPLLAEKVKEFAYNTLRMTFSLTLFRDIMNLLGQQHLHLKKLKRYFQQMNRELSEGDFPETDPVLQIDQTFQEDKDYLFQEAQKGEIRKTRLLEIDALSDEIEENCKRFVPAKTITAETQQTLPKYLNPEEMVKEEPLQRSNNLVNFFSSAVANQDANWWKSERYVSDESKQISQFDKKGCKLISQKSIARLVLDEMKRDLNREIELGKDIQRHEDSRVLRFNKMMKGKLVSAKIKKKGKKSPF